MNRYRRKRARYLARVASWQRRSDVCQLDGILDQLDELALIVQLRRDIESFAAACRTIRIETPLAYIEPPDGLWLRIGRR